MDRISTIAERVAGTRLTRHNVKRGVVIQNTKHPEWGTWGVGKEYSRGLWEIDGRRGGRVLDEGEFDEWEIVKTASVKTASVKTAGDVPTKQEVKSLLYKPEGDYFLQSKPDGMYLTLYSVSDAHTIFSKRFDARFDREELGLGRAGMTTYRITRKGASRTAAMPLSSAMEIALNAALGIWDGIEGMMSEEGEFPGRYWKKNVQRKMVDAKRHKLFPMGMVALLDDLIDGLEGVVSEKGSADGYWKSGMESSARAALQYLLAAIRSSPGGTTLASSDWMTAAEVGEICKACGEKMAAQGISRVRRSYFEEALRKASKVAKVVDPVLNDPREDARLQAEMKDVGHDVQEMADQDEEGVRSAMIVRDKARYLAHKYAKFYVGMEKALRDRIESDIWEYYHSGN